MNSLRNNSSLKPLLLLSFGALCISFAAIFVKLVGREVLGPTAIGFWRTMLGAIILFVWVMIKRDSYRMPLPIFGFSVLAGFVFFLDLFFWHRSILYSGAGMATILANTQVFWMAVLGSVIFRERLNVGFVGATIGAFVGVTLLIGVGSEVSFTLTYVKGIAYGLITGAVYSGYLITLKKAGHRKECPSILTLVAWTSFFTAVFFCISMLLESDPYLPPDLLTMFILFSLALVAQAAGWWVITSSLPRLKASRSGLVLLLQPLLATIWGVWFFGEQLTWLQVVGAAVTLGAIYFGSVRQGAKS